MLLEYTTTHENAFKPTRANLTKSLLTLQKTRKLVKSNLKYFAKKIKLSTFLTYIKNKSASIPLPITIGVMLLLLQYTESCI